VPVVVDDPVPVRAGAGEHGGVPGAGGGGGVGVVAVLEPRPVVLQPDEPAGAEQRLPLVDVVAAHLVEHDEDGELDPRLASRLRRRGAAGGGGDEAGEQDEEGGGGCGAAHAGAGR